MSRIAKPHRILARTLATAAVAALAAAAPAAADGPDRIPTTFVSPTCGGPNEIIECAPPVEHRHSAADDVLLATCGGPNEIVVCRRRSSIATPPSTTFSWRPAVGRTRSSNARRRSKHPHAATETEAQPTCGGPNDIIECAPPVESEPRRR